jgi:hypothetical protein
MWGRGPTVVTRLHAADRDRMNLAVRYQVRQTFETRKEPSGKAKLRAVAGESKRRSVVRAWEEHRHRLDIAGELVEE